MIYYKLIITVVCCCTVFYTQAQEKELKKEAAETEIFRPHHRISIVMQNAHLPKAIEIEGTKKNFLVPAWGFDYDYWFHRKWAVGLHNDLILQQYKVEKAENNTEVVRDFPISVALVALYKPFNHLTFITGIGHEFEKNEGLYLIDIGMEYGWELPKNWEMGLSMKYENKFNAYNTWLFGIGISKMLYNHK